MPLFVAHGPGVWLQRVMVVLVTLIPLWVVFGRRVQAGRWTMLEEADRNRSWTPPSDEAPAVEAEPALVARTVSARASAAWMIAGAIGAIAAIGAGFVARSTDGLSVSRDEAIAIARRALDARGAKLPSGARFMAVPQDGEAITPHRFISETAGEDRRKALVGAYLPKPRWLVRVATFEGDVALRAEEWQVFVTDAGDAWPIVHEVPEARPGASLDEVTARALALDAVATRFHLDPGRGDLKVVLAKPTKQAARIDWEFAFEDKTVPPLPQGEPRIGVSIAGDEVTGIGRSIHTPESWIASRASWKRATRSCNSRRRLRRSECSLPQPFSVLSRGAAGATRPRCSSQPRRWCSCARRCCAPTRGRHCLRA